jgi:serine protease Do
MKRIDLKILPVVFALAFAPAALQAQEGDKKKEVEQIIITKKGDKNEKVTIEINGDKVTVNGKPVDDYKDDNITIDRHKGITLRGRAGSFGPESLLSGDGQNMLFFSQDEKRAMLGVVTEKADEGVEINEVSDESAAEKAGLKENDIITKIDNEKIESPDELSKVIREHKPGDKVTVTYLRDKKEQKATVELGKFKGISTYSITGTEAPYGLNQDMFHQFEDMQKDYKGKQKDYKLKLEQLDKLKTIPRTPRAYGFGDNNFNFSWSGDQPKLGLSVQDTEDGKGVNVLEVDEESNAAKAGIKENDIITQINDKAVNSADEVAKIVRENKTKPSLKLQITRNGKSQNIEVKMPRKLKTADL